MRRIVVVGGVAGGASAAAKARRVDETADIQIFERGPHISFANCGLPYHIAGDIPDRSKLLIMTPDSFWSRSRVRAHVNHQVIRILRDKKTIEVQGPDGKIREVPYDKLILSQGARPIVPPFEGVNNPNVFTLRDIPDMDRIVNFIGTRSPRSAVVIGAGFIGLEMAEAFLHRGMDVTVIEKSPHILPTLDPDMGAYFESQLRGDNFHFRCGIGAAAFTGHSVILEDGTEIPAELILMSVGVRAEIELAKSAGLEIGKSGGVKANGRMESSDPDIYVVGDAAETTHAITGMRVRIPLAGPANRQGRIAGANAAGGRLIYPGALGTAIVRVLHQTAGTTGLNSSQADAAGFTFFSSLTRDFTHASYYPGAKPIMLKILAEEGTGRLLGAQAIGEDGVDKRIDVLATAIAARMTVFDLENLDLAYSPPFGSANDPVNTSGFVASHIARGDVKTLSPETWRPDGEFLLDVRDADELEEFGFLPAAKNIPLSALRDHLSEVPRERPVVTYCQKGQRGYLAACILHGHGYGNVANLRGGFIHAKMCGLPIQKT